MRVGPYDYQVLYEKPHSAGAVGETDADHLTIRIDPDLPKERQRVILWHEGLHAIIECLSINIKGEEDLVDRLAPALVEFVDRNRRML